MGDRYRAMKGDTRSLDYSSYEQGTGGCQSYGSFEDFHSRVAPTPNRVGLEFRV